MPPRKFWKEKTKKKHPTEKIQFIAFQKRDSLSQIVGFVYVKQYLKVKEKNQ